MNKKYFYIQLAMEGLQIDDNNRISKLDVNYFDIEKKENSEIPKIIVLQSNDLIEIFYSINLSNKIVSKLKDINETDFLNNSSKILKILNDTTEVGNYVTYIFPKSFEVDETNTAIYLNSGDIKLKDFDSSFYQVFPKAYSVLENKKIVACCVSSRESDKAGEAWIYTLPKYRQKGYGTKSVKLWANDLLNNHKIPFYSHEQSNNSSKILAEKLGLIKAFEIKVYE